VTVESLPHLNAALNALSTILIVTGYVHIRRKRVTAHKTCMLSAAATSVLFLISYVIYHYQAGHTTFAHPGFIKVVYLSILFSHVILAACVPVLVVITISFAFLGRIDRHRRIARWTLPIWLYVSVTGVIVYAMLYHLYPAPESV